MSANGGVRVAAREGLDWLRGGGGGCRDIRLRLRDILHPGAADLVRIDVRMQRMGRR